MVGETAVAVYEPPEPAQSEEPPLAITYPAQDSNSSRSHSIRDSLRDRVKEIEEKFYNGHYDRISPVVSSHSNQQQSRQRPSHTLRNAGENFLGGNLSKTESSGHAAYSI